MRILVIGGYGFFGRRLVKRLLRLPALHIIVAGRSSAAAQAFVAQCGAGAALTALELDAMAQTFGAHLTDLAPHIVVNASGPFQGQDYRVALACIKARVHYIDLADGREFVSGITGLNEAATAAGVLAISGASTVPALSSAVADHLAEGLERVTNIDISITPGNRTERGLSTVKAIMSYCGKALPASGGKPVFGWRGSYAHRYPAPVGRRLLSPCDVPDLTLLPARYRGTPQLRFGAGLELEFLHRGMNLLAWLARHRLVDNWSNHAGLLKRAADLFLGWGTDAGAMHVAVEGTVAGGGIARRTWYLVAEHGDGPYVPTLAAAALIRKLANGQAITGARACIGVLTLEDFINELDGLHIATSEVRQ